MKTMTSRTPLAEKILIYTELSNLAADFNYSAKTYAKIVKKTLKKLRTNIFRLLEKLDFLMNSRQSNPMLQVVMQVAKSKRNLFVFQVEIIDIW
jgi:hypothetical protein